MLGLWFPVHIGFCPDDEAWARYMKTCNIAGEAARYPTDDERDEAHFSSFEHLSPKASYEPFGVITMSKKLDSGDPTMVTSCLVHESVHAFQFVCDRMGERRPSSEFQAYGIQAIYRFMESHYSRLRWRDGEENRSKETDHAAAEQVGSANRRRVPRKRRSDKK